MAQLNGRAHMMQQEQQGRQQEREQQQKGVQREGGGTPQGPQAGQSGTAQRDGNRGFEDSVPGPGHGEDTGGGGGFDNGGQDRQPDSRQGGVESQYAVKVNMDAVRDLRVQDRYLQMVRDRLFENKIDLRTAFKALDEDGDGTTVSPSRHYAFSSCQLTPCPSQASWTRKSLSEGWQHSI